MYDVVIVGGGPAGLSAALALGRARRRVLLCDAGTPRNGRAHEIHNFVTRDGTTPREFRRLGREQLLPYESVQLREQHVRAIDGERGAFVVQLDDGPAQARRVLLCLGMIDELPALPGYRELWGHAIFQCPYCHGYEVRDGAFGYLAPAVETLDFALVLTCWTHDLVVFTDGKFAVPDDTRARLEAAAVRIEERPLAGLVPHPGTSEPPRLAAVSLEGGTMIERAYLFAHPPQRQSALVLALGLALDEQGMVRVDAMRRETSRAGIYAAGDMVTKQQAAVVAAAAGTLSAAMLNHELTLAAAHEKPPASGPARGGTDA